MKWIQDFFRIVEYKISFFKDWENDEWLKDLHMNLIEVCNKVQLIIIKYICHDTTLIDQKLGSVDSIVDYDSR